MGKPFFASRLSRNTLGMTIIDDRTRYSEEGDHAPMTDYDQLAGEHIDFFRVEGRCANPDCVHNQDELREQPLTVLGLCVDCTLEERAPIGDLCDDDFPLQNLGDEDEDEDEEWICRSDRGGDDD
jgi:hypothetical protein